MTYKEFIQSIIDARGQWGISESEYFELHHIIPFCIGGKGDFVNNRFRKLSHNENCIWLYPEEHYLAHKLLAEENPTNEKLVYAWHRISLCKKQFLSADDYAKLKRLRRELGFTEEHKKKISESLKGTKHPELSKFNTETKKGKLLSKDIIEKMKIAQTGENNGNAKKVLKIDTGEVFDTLKDAVRSINEKSSGNLSHAINHCNGYYKGYHWKYLKK